MKKKLKLKESVKRGLIAIGLLILMIMLVLLNNRINKAAINQCVNNGNTYNYCVSGL